MKKRSALTWWQAPMSIICVCFIVGGCSAKDNSKPTSPYNGSTAGYGSNNGSGNNSTGNATNGNTNGANGTNNGVAINNPNGGITNTPVTNGAYDGTIGNPVTVSSDPEVGTATGRWHTGLDPSTKRYVFIDPDGKKRVLRGVSLTGHESGTINDASGGGYWMYDPGQSGGDPKAIVANVVKALNNTWNPDVVRIPICGTAWQTPYKIHDWSNNQIMDYPDWIDLVVKAVRAAGKVAIIDMHLWQIAPLSSAGMGISRVNDETGKPYVGPDGKPRVDGCVGYQKVQKKHTCSSSDYTNSNPLNWSCTVANAEGITLQNAHYNRKELAKTWAKIAARYKDDSGVFYELYNEPYEQVDTGAAFGSDEIAVGKLFPDEDKYDWPMWHTVMETLIKAVREDAGADNIVLVNGLMWGYTFHGPIKEPEKYLKFAKTYKNLAYAFHPYQHGTCCGDVGTDTDNSKTDPYYATYCRYFKNGTGTKPASTNLMLPTQTKCATVGYEPTRPMGMPPCKWVANAYNPKGGTGLCVGQPDVCEPLSQDACNKVDRGSPAAGGWSRYVLPMTQYGPIISTELGTFDCSSPFIAELMDYSDKYDVSYTAWALWPQNNGGTLSMGMCSYPGITEPFPNLNSPYEADFKICKDLSSCETAMKKPMRWAGQYIFDNIAKHAGGK